MQFKNHPAKKKSRLVFIIKPTGASASTWKAVEKQLEVTEEVAAPQVCADTDSVCPCNCVFHAVIYMNRARWCQCSDQAQQCQVQQWVSSFFSQLLLPLECYHHFYSVSMIYHWLWWLCPLLLQKQPRSTTSVSTLYTLFICWWNKSQVKNND